MLNFYKLYDGDNILEKIDNKCDYFVAEVNKQNQPQNKHHKYSNQHARAAALVFALFVMLFKQVNVTGVGFIIKIEDLPDERDSPDQPVDQYIKHH